MTSSSRKGCRPSRAWSAISLSSRPRFLHGSGRQQPTTARHGGCGSSSAFTPNSGIPRSSCNRQQGAQGGSHTTVSAAQLTSPHLSHSLLTSSASSSATPGKPANLNLRDGKQADTSKVCLPAQSRPAHRTVPASAGHDQPALCSKADSKPLSARCADGSCALEFVVLKEPVASLCPVPSIPPALLIRAMPQ